MNWGAWRGNEGRPSSTGWSPSAESVGRRNGKATSEPSISAGCIIEARFLSEARRLASEKVRSRKSSRLDPSAEDRVPPWS